MTSGLVQDDTSDRQGRLPVLLGPHTLHTAIATPSLLPHLEDVAASILVAVGPTQPPGSVEGEGMVRLAV